MIAISNSSSLRSGGRVAITLALSSLLAVALEFAALGPTAGAPFPATPGSYLVGQSHVSCPPGTDGFALPRPGDDANGWTGSSEASPVYSDGVFSVRVREHKGTVADNVLDFYGAFPEVVRVFVTNSVGTAIYPPQNDYPPGTFEDSTGLSGPTSAAEPEPDPNPPIVDLIEFCYVPPPPPPSDCPGKSIYWNVPEPDGGWTDGTYTDGSFSVDLDFSFRLPRIEGQRLTPDEVAFAGASRGVRTVFIADESNGVARYPDAGQNYRPPTTADDSLTGPEQRAITRIEFCYLPLPAPTPTLSLPTPTMPLPTATLPLPTATPTDRPPTASPSPSPSPSPTPTPTTSATITTTASPVITAEPTSEPSVPPTDPPLPSPTTEPTPSPTDEQPAPVLPRFFGNIPPPAQISFDPTAVGFSVLLVVLFLLLALFPASLFNETIEENYEVIAGWFGRGSTRMARLRGLIARFWQGWFGVAFFLLLSGVIYGFLDPSFGLDAESIALFLGIVVGLAITTAAFELPIVLVQRRINLERGVVRVLPLTILIALACVLVSRIAEFQPGYLYGMVAFWAFERALPRRSAGLAVALTCTLILMMALAAWVALPGVEQALAGSPLLATFAATVLAVIFIGGLEGLLVELVPIRFLRGQHVWAWRKSVWLVLFGIGGFAFVHILLHPGVDYLFQARGEAVAVAVIFFVGFAALSVGTWAFFRYLYKPSPA